MNELIIRELTSEDYDCCVELIREGFGTVAKDFKLTEQNCPTNPAFIRTEHLVESEKKHCRMFGLCLDEKMIGFMQLEKAADKKFELRKITILPDYRHFGYGKLLLDFAKIKVREMGGGKLTLGIIEDNTVLKLWYEENGFSSVGTQQFDHLPFIVGYMEATI